VNSSEKRIGASGLDLVTVDHLLTTTRAVRKRLDFARPVARDVLIECLELATQAPTGSNAETWRFVVVTDPDVRAALAAIFKRAQRPKDVPPPPAPADALERIKDSVAYLREHIDQVPAFVVPCVEATGGAAGWPPSIYPAVWSFMLALRSRGLGSVLTTVHLFRKEEAATLLGIPDGYVQACLLPVAYFTGDDFKPAHRRPIAEVAFSNRWGTPLQ
jgi:nitroreductase